MAKIRVPTKFNRTGRRVLTTPLDEKRIYAPAYRQYRERYQTADHHWRTAWSLAKEAYVQAMACLIAEYVANGNTPINERYRVAKSLATLSLQASIGSDTWAKRLGISSLDQAETFAWETCVKATREAEENRETALQEASLECEEMKRSLRQEIRSALTEHSRYLESKKNGSSLELRQNG